MKKITLAALLCCLILQSDAQAESFGMSDAVKVVADNYQKAAMVLVATLLARPAVKLATQYLYGKQEAFGSGSLLGTRFHVKPASKEKSERVRAQVSLGSLDVKLKVPTRLGLDGLDLKKRALNDGAATLVADALAEILSRFSPYVHVGLADKDTPIVRNKEAGVSAKSKRLFAEAACGTFCVRTGMDLEDAMLAPVALVAAYLASYFSDVAPSGVQPSVVSP